MQFVAFERAKQGTGASRRLRITGRTPGIIFGGEAEPANIELDHNALWHALKKETFHASILDMELDGKVQKVLLRDVQYHPFKQLVLHVDFQRVNAKTRLHKKVPLHFINADQSPAVKVDNCVISHVMTEIEVECLAMQLPEHIEVDLANMVKGQTIHARELTMPKNVKRVTHGRTNLTVVIAVPPKVEVAAPVVEAVVDDKKGKKGGKK
jgi:large subunit ribosomal protein L25